MVELTDDEKKVVEAMKGFHAVSGDKLKDTDQIAKAAMLPKGKVANVLMSLSGKKVIRRVAREKAAGYYIIDQTV